MQRQNRNLAIYLLTSWGVTLVLALLGLHWLECSSDQLICVFFGGVLVVALYSPVQTLIEYVASLALQRKYSDRRCQIDQLEKLERTIVIIPCLLTDLATVDRLLVALSDHFQNNPEFNVRFGMLSDFSDSLTECAADDTDLLRRACDGIESLNAAAGGAHFFLLHRPRIHAGAQGVWMGWERKRGKLCQFNEFLLTGDSSAFAATAGCAQDLLGSRYVITVDADTGLPPGSVRQMVVSMALKHAQRHDTDQPIICQPRMVARLPEHPTWFQTLAVGLTPPVPSKYPAVCVQQELFESAAFFGKGIYEVAEFQRQINGQLPDNWILSHDVVESGFARTHALSHIEVSELPPSNVLSEMQRRARWIRGDWQNLPWMLPWAPAQVGWKRNPMSLVSRWRIFENLRRSLQPIVVMLLLLVAAVAQIDSRATCVLLFTLFALPALVADFVGLIIKDRRVTWSAHFQFFQACLLRQCISAGMAITFVASDAENSARAIITACWRMVGSRRRMLEWVASDVAERRLNRGVSAHLRAFWAAMAIGSLLLCITLVGGRSPAMLFVGALWLLSPAIAWQLGRAVPAHAGAMRWVRRNVSTTEADANS